MCAFGLFSGMTLGPALDFAIAVDPRYSDITITLPAIIIL